MLVLSTIGGKVCGITCTSTDEHPHPHMCRCGNKVPVGRTVVVGITHIVVALMSMEYGGQISGL